VIAEAIAAGVAAGIVSGLFGVGGGVVFVPALVYIYDASQVGAEATSLLAIIPVALVGAWRQHEYGNVRVREGIVIGLCSRRAGRSVAWRWPTYCRNARSRSRSPA
jgi:uncharacterized membrane protein YfcA